MKRKKKIKRTIIDAMEDPRLFGSDFTKESWSAWKAFLKAVFILPMTDSEMDLFRQCTGREKPPEVVREAYAICGMGAGKSRIAALIATYLSAFRSYDSILPAGALATIMLLAGDKDQAEKTSGTPRDSLKKHRRSPDWSCEEHQAFFSFPIGPELKSEHRTSGASAEEHLRP